MNSKHGSAVVHQHSSEHSHVALIQYTLFCHLPFITNHNQHNAPYRILCKYMMFHSKFTNFPVFFLIDS